MRQVRMITTAAGPDGTYTAGSRATVEDEVAAAWIAGGYAAAVDEVPVPEVPAAEAALPAESEGDVPAVVTPEATPKAPRAPRAPKK